LRRADRDDALRGAHATIRNEIFLRRDRGRLGAAAVRSFRRWLMSRMLCVFASAMLLTTSVIAMQRGPARPAPAPQTQDMTLTGCVIAGNNAGTVILDNALERLGTNEKPRAFRLVGAAEDVDFMPHLNHRVQIVGTADRREPPPPPAGAKLAERDLPLLTVKTIQELGDTCAGH
jgi:hypothetical protein